MKKKVFIMLVCACSFMEHAYAERSYNHIVIEGIVTDNTGNVMSDVMITDGRTVVSTDDKGQYKLLTSSEKDFVYFSLPSGYNVAYENSLPRFYRNIDKDKEQQRIDFTLHKADVDQTKHSFIVWADPQVYRAEEFSQLKEVVDDVQATVAGLDKPCHAISVGDNVFDRHNLIDEYVKTISTLNMPFYHAVGNHDMDYNGRSNEGAARTYSSYFGPDYYSFNVGDIHYVVLNDVFYYGYTYRYIGYLTEEQLNWLEQDLSYIPKGKTLVLSMHIPTMYDMSDPVNDYTRLMSDMVMNNAALYKLLDGYNVHIMAGHSHVQWNSQISDNILEHTHAAASGAWWQGDYCTDGSPNGYTVYEVDGNDISWYFKGKGCDKEDQMRLYVKEDTLIVNVFNYDDNWKLEYFEDGRNTGTPERYLGVDPIAKQAYEPGKNKMHGWLGYSKTGHLFKVKINNTSARLKVVVTDRFGNKYEKEVAPYTLVWSDEFDKEGLPDKRKWSFDTHGNASGWGNNEAQFYTANDKKNAFVSGGTLKIVAHKEEKHGKQYTSARLITKGKGDWKYGKVEVRAKLPGGKGTWPAIWMLPSENKYGGWPSSGEIDIMENVGYDPDTIVSTAHTGQYNHVMGTQRSGKFGEPTCASEFHTYTLEWDEYGWRTYIDDRPIYEWQNDCTGYQEWPFDEKFHLILNLAIGGNWGGKYGVDDTIFPRTLEIDYVRVFQRI